LEFKHISYERVENIALITLNRPEKLNAFTLRMMHELCSVFDRVDTDDQVKAALITGAGRAFCAGADLSSGEDTFVDKFDTQDSHPEDYNKDAGGILTLRMFRSLKPIVTACNGASVGVGATMQLAADIRLASTKARFGFVFLNRGIVNDASSSWFLPKIVGISKALELCYSGRIIDAQEASDIGLVSHIFEHEEMLDRSIDFCKNLTQGSAPVSVALARRLFWSSLGDDGPERSHELESQFISSRGKSGDAKEGVKSFLEKRDAEFPNKVSKDLPNDFEKKIEN
jgi:enoyl-CoA hydratase/carnithine racemase